MKQFLLLAILAIFAFVPQVSAQDLPDLPKVFDSEQNEVVYSDEGGNVYAVVVSDPKGLKDQFNVYNGSILVINNSNVQIAYYKYQLVDGSWNAVTSDAVYSYTSKDITVNGLEFISSNIDIYDYTSKELVFPLPEEGLHLLPGKLMEENKVDLVETITKAIKIILLCGVSCLAYVISLPILAKVFSIFQVK